MSKVDKQLDDWIKMGLGLGMSFVDVYAPDQNKAPLAVTFAQDDPAYQKYVESLTEQAVEDAIWHRTIGEE